MEESTPRGCFGFLQVGRWAPSTCPRWSRWSDCVRPPRVRVCVANLPACCLWPPSRGCALWWSHKGGKYGQILSDGGSPGSLLPQNGRAAYTKGSKRMRERFSQSDVQGWEYPWCYLSSSKRFEFTSLQATTSHPASQSTGIAGQGGKKENFSSVVQTKKNCFLRTSAMTEEREETAEETVKLHLRIGPPSWK